MPSELNQSSMVSETPPRPAVLIADDDAAILKLVTAIVQAEGYEVVAANDGKQAYKLLQSNHQIRAVIVDIRMPYIEGTELLRFMRSNERFSDIPVIVMTAGTDPKATSSSFNAGAAAFLSKPFTNSQLRLMLKTVLDSR